MSASTCRSVNLTARSWTKGIVTRASRLAAKNPIPMYIMGSIINKPRNPQRSSVLLFSAKKLNFGARTAYLSPGRGWTRTNNQSTHQRGAGHGQDCSEIEGEGEDDPDKKGWQARVGDEAQDRTSPA